MKPFAFYGRVSTEDQQDPASSRAWQLRRALELIEPNGGAVVAEGTPEQVAAIEESYTGAFLRNVLG